MCFPVLEQLLLHCLCKFRYQRRRKWMLALVWWLDWHQRLHWKWARVLCKDGCGRLRYELFFFLPEKHKSDTNFMVYLFKGFESVVHLAYVPLVLSFDFVTSSFTSVSIIADVKNLRPTTMHIISWNSIRII